MAKRLGHISRRELLARSIAFGGVAMIGSFTRLFGQEALSEGPLLPASDVSEHPSATFEGIETEDLWSCRARPNRSSGGSIFTTE